MNPVVKHILAVIFTPALVTLAASLKDGGLSESDLYVVGAAFIGGLVAYLTDPSSEAK